MAEKAIKFLSLEDAINEVFLDLAVNPEKWYDLALFAKVYGFLTKGCARPGKSDSTSRTGRKEEYGSRPEGQERKNLSEHLILKSWLLI